MSTGALPLRRNRDFHLLWAGQAVSALGSRASSVAYPLLVLAITGSPAQAGVVGSAATVPFLLVQLPAGVLVDRVDRRRAMLACDAGRLCALAGLAAAVAAGHAAVAVIAAVAFVEGCLGVTFDLAERGAVQALVPEAQLESALAQNEARVRGAALAGQPLGGLLFGLGRVVPFAADAASYAVSLVTLAAIDRPFPASSGEREPRHALAELSEGLRWLWGQPFLRATTILVAGSNGLFQAVTLAVIVTARAHGASPGAIGLILAGFGAGGLAGAAAAGMAFVGPIWNVVIGSLDLRLTPAHLLGRVRAVHMTAAFGAIPLGSLTGGFLLDRLGPSATVWALAAGMLGVALAATASPAVRRPPATSPAAA